VKDFAVMASLRLAKYEGAGNDFLVAVEAEVSSALTKSPSLVAALCERHRGIGADGLIVVAPIDAARLSMTLYNADGGLAETSGNGLRCAVLAAHDAGLIEEDVVIETGAGTARAQLRTSPDGGPSEVRVEMGACAVETVPEAVEGRDAYRVDVGNPHLVLIGPLLDAPSLVRIGPRLERAVAGGQNVESVASLGTDRLELTVWERGAGLTEACGTGSCAAAAAARLAGLVGDTVVVVNPGGELLVELSGPPERPLAALTGPVRRIAAVVVELSDYSAGARR